MMLKLEPEEVKLALTECERLGFELFHLDHPAPETTRTNPKVKAKAQPKPTPPPEATIDELEDKSHADLQKIAKNLGISAGGSSKQIRKRIRKAID